MVLYKTRKVLSKRVCNIRCLQFLLKDHARKYLSAEVGVKHVKHLEIKDIGSLLCQRWWQYLASKAGNVLVKGILDQKTDSNIIPGMMITMKNTTMATTNQWPWTRSALLRKWNLVKAKSEAWAAAVPSNPATSSIYILSSQSFLRIDKPSKRGSLDDSEAVCHHKNMEFFRHAFERHVNLPFCLYNHSSA